MKNFEETLSTWDIILSIKKDVYYAMLYYKNNSDWKTYVRTAYYKFRTLCLVAMKGDFNTAFEELVQVTGFRKLCKYKAIRVYIFELGK